MTRGYQPVKFNNSFLQSLATIIHQYVYLTPMTKKLLLKLILLAWGAIFPVAWGVPKSLREYQYP